MSFRNEKGIDLEQRIAAFLRTHDYEVATNVIRKGRSGASHELDVVGKKKDALTSFELIIECKAWESPIDKEVVYKLAAELADLGAAKGVIATLSGWTVQAEQAAVQSNIELWGPAELTSRLGQLSISELHSGPAPVKALGLPFTVSSEAALIPVTRLAKGTLGIGSEEIGWYGPLWLPLWSMQLGITRSEGLIKKASRVTPAWNSYEALTATCVSKGSAPMNFTNVDLSSGHIKPILKESQVKDYLNKSVANWKRTKTKQAKDREEINLTRLGIPTPLQSLAVDSSALTFFPLWIAILRRRGQERIVAIDGITGGERRRISESLTTNAQRVRDALSQ